MMMHSRIILKALNADGLESPGVACLPLSETVNRWKALTALALRHLSDLPGWQGIVNAPLADESGLSDLRQLLGAYTAASEGGKGNPFASFSAAGQVSGFMPGYENRFPQTVNTPVVRNRESMDNSQAAEASESLRLTRQKASRISAKVEMAESGHSLTSDPEKETEKTRPVRPHTRLSAAVRKWEKLAQISPLENDGFRTISAPLSGTGELDTLHQFFAPRQEAQLLSGDSPAVFPRKESASAGVEAFGEPDNSRGSDFIGEREVPKDKTQFRNKEKRGTEFKGTHDSGDQAQPVGAALVKSYLDALTESDNTGMAVRPHIENKSRRSHDGSFSSQKITHLPTMTANQNRSPDIEPSRPAFSAQETQGRKRPASLLPSHRLSAKDSGQYLPTFSRKPEAVPSEARRIPKGDNVSLPPHMEGLAVQKSPMKTGVRNRGDEQNSPDSAITELIDRAFTSTSRLKPAAISGNAQSPDLADVIRSASPRGSAAHRKRRQQASRDFRPVSKAKLSGGMSTLSTHSDVFQHVVSPSPFYPPGSSPQESGNVGQGEGGNQKERLLEALVAGYWERRKGQSGRVRAADVAEMNEKPIFSTTSVQKRAEHLIVERNIGEPEIIARSGDEDGESPDALSRKINDILIEQARRYGIDL